MDHGLKHISFYVQQRVVAMGMCYNPVLIRDKPLGARASVKRVYCSTWWLWYLLWNFHHVIVTELWWWLVQERVMACYRQATNHYLGQCGQRSMSPYGVTRPQWTITRNNINNCSKDILKSAIMMPCIIGKEKWIIWGMWNDYLLNLLNWRIAESRIKTKRSRIKTWTVGLSY